MIFLARWGEEVYDHDRRSREMAIGTFSLSNIQVRGRVGDLVFVPTSDGRLIVRRAPTYRPDPTPAQREGERRMKLAAAAWQRLTLEEGEAWGRFAAAEGRRAYSVFFGLSAKRLQMRPDEPLPRLPPTGGFLGDGIVVDCRFSIDDSRLIFQASGPNAAGVVTELLVQRLAGLHRKPLVKAYTSRGFVHFAGGALAVPLEAPPGAYACAIRFVREATGQETAIVPLGKVVVPDARP